MNSTLAFIKLFETILKLPSGTLSASVASGDEKFARLVNGWYEWAFAQNMFPLMKLLTSFNTSAPSCLEDPP